MNKIITFILFFPFVSLCMHQPKSLKELARAKVPQDQLNEILLETIKQTAWEIVSYNTAQYEQNLQSIKTLLDAGADPNYCDPEKKFPLIYFAGNCIKTSGLRDWHPVPDPENYRYEVVRMLLSRGANPNLITPSRTSSFLWGAKKDFYLLRIFLEAGADPNALYNSDTLLIDYALYNNGEPVAESAMLLLAYEADAQLTNGANETALDAARKYKNQKLITLLEDLKIKRLG